MSLDGSSLNGSGSTTIVDGDESDSATIVDVRPEIASTIYESSDLEIDTDDLMSSIASESAKPVGVAPNVLFRYAPSIVAGHTRLLGRDDRKAMAEEEKAKYPLVEFDETILEELVEWEQCSDVETQIERRPTTDDNESPVLLFKRIDVCPKRKKKPKKKKSDVIRTVIPYPVPKYWATQIRPYVSEDDLKDAKTRFDWSKRERSFVRAC